MTSPITRTLSAAQHDDADDVDYDGGGSTPLLGSVGRIIAAFRKQAGLTQGEFGELIGYGDEMVSKVERGIRIPRPEFLDNADRVLNAHGVLSAMKEEIARASYTDIQRSLHQEEAQATGIHTYDTLVLHPLLQTEDYMRAVFAMRTPPLPATAVDQRVATRLERQNLLHRDPAPLASFVIDEALLRRPYGGNDVLRAQLKHLLELGHLPHIDLQVMPLNQEDNAGIGGPFTLLDTRKQTRIAFTEVQNTRIHTERDRIRHLDTIYGRIRAQALSPKQTLHLIEELLTENSATSSPAIV